MIREGQLFTFTFSDVEVGRHGVLGAQGGEQEDEETGQIKYDIRLQKSKIVSAETISDSFLFISGMSPVY